MKSIILCIIFFNIHAFVSLDYLNSGIAHKKIYIKNCKEFEERRNILYFLGYAYVFEQHTTLNFLKGKVESYTYNEHPTALKSDGTFYEHGVNTWYNTRWYGTFKGCNNNKLVFDYSKYDRRVVLLKDTVFYSRGYVYHINADSGMKLSNCDVYNAHNEKFKGRHNVNYFTDDRGIYYAVGNENGDALFSFQEFDSLAWHYTIDFDKEDVFRYNGCIDEHQLQFYTSKGEKKLFDLEKITFFNPKPSDTLPTYDKPSFESISPLKETSKYNEFNLIKIASCEGVLNYFPEYKDLIFTHKDSLFLTRGNKKFLFKKNSEDQFEINSKFFWYFEKCEAGSLYLSW